MSDQPTFQAVITDSLARLEFPVSITPLPDKFGADYKALHDFHIAQLAKEVAEAPPITDKASFEVNQKLRTRLVKTRTGLDSTRKALFDPMRQLKAEVDAYIGTTPDAGLQGRIKEQERIIEAKQLVWEEEQERIRQAAQKIIEDRNKARAKALDELGFRFDGAAFWIGDHGHPLAMRIAQGAAYTMTDKEWNETIEVATRNSAELAMEKQAEDDFAALLAAGMTQDRTTGAGVYDEEELITVEELHGAPRQRFEALLAKIQGAEATKAKLKAEQEAAQAQAESEAKEKLRRDQLALESERATMMRERLLHRCDVLESLGAHRDPAAKLMRVFVGVEFYGEEEGMESRDYDFLTIGKATAEEWATLLANIEDEVKRGAELIAAKRAAHDAAAKEAPVDFYPTQDQAHPQLIQSPNLPGIFYDEQGMPVSKEGAPIILAPQPKPDFEELHACALALLDEANKALSLHACAIGLPRMQELALEAVEITKALRA
jgi:hypothetical protein